MVKKYIKKPVTISAIKFSKSNIEEIRYFVGDNLISKNEKYYIKTLEGKMECKEGDYIIKGIMGEFYPCEKRIFELTYDLYREGE